MPDVATILELAPAAGFLAANALDKSALFYRGRLNPLLPQQIYGVYFVAKKIYDKDPNYNGLVPVCNYLWEIMGRYGVAAQQYTGGGGSVAPITPPQTAVYPFIITQDYFESDGITYINTDMGVTDIVSIFPDQYTQQWLLEGAETFERTATGFIVRIPGFDANSQTWTIMVQQIFPVTVPTPPVTENTLLINSTDSLLINSTDSLLISL